MNFSRAFVLGAALAVAAVAEAHHSFAMFDADKEQTIEGVVKEFQWTNPHIWIVVNVTGTDGKVVEYNIEGASPNGLRREGWTRNSMKPGDKVVLTMHPLRDGAPGGSFMSAVVNGRPLTRGANVPEQPGSAAK
ncbi:MAG: DUF6152 family protein [Steroidobacteraceae bacterium]